jgi:hypothetical protein
MGACVNKAGILRWVDEADTAEPQPGPLFSADCPAG